MAEFHVVSGDLFSSNAQTLVNPVNCVGVMGKGIALEFKKRYPAMFDDYVRRCRNGAVRLGEPYLYSDSSGVRILNFPTKGHWRLPSRLSYIDSGLEYLARHACEWGVTSLAMPALGCGNGGLRWEDVWPFVRARLWCVPVEVWVFLR